MDLFRLDRSDSVYPTALNHYLGKDAPLSVAALGNLEIVTRKKLALFCSVKCPAKLILQTHDLAHALVQARITVIGGFHSPVEKECLRILLRGRQPVIICPARSLRKLRILKELKKPRIIPAKDFFTSHPYASCPRPGLEIPQGSPERLT